MVARTGVRAASTAATRQAIIDAARRMLAERSWREFTLEAVAAAAGVTRVTIYNQVQSKSGLLDAVLTDVAERAGMDRLLTSSADMAPADARRFIVDRTIEFWHKERAVLRPLFGLAAVDAEIAAHLEQREQWRSDQFDRLLDRFGPIVEGLSRPTVRAGLVAVTSFLTYDRLGPIAEDPHVAAELIHRMVASLIPSPPVRSSRASRS
jgi:AcrR family transcriptional regulator